jgi:hypothetical protein
MRAGEPEVSRSPHAEMARSLRLLLLLSSLAIASLLRCVVGNAETGV